MTQNNSPAPTVQFHFPGARVVVTGGTSGIGQAVAAAFATAGADVTVTGTRDAAADYPDLLPQLRYHPLRLDDSASVAAFAASVGAVDVLVNNAGHTMPGASFASAVQVNLTAVHELTSALHERLKASTLPGGASVVNLASMMSFFGSPYFHGYGAAKAGIVQLTRTFAAAWARDGIRVNAVAPGSVPTAMTAPYANDPAIRDMVNAKTPMARWAAPEEIAAAIQYLSSSAASFVTGHTLVVDGGYSIID
jgi:NAD(P)-dependent dehydrogenase (short-subunit alcohol dehydrogenase family)